MSDTLTSSIRLRCRNFLSITASRTEYLIANKTIPSRPIDPINIFEPAAYRHTWEFIIRKDQIKYANLTITFSDGIRWDLRDMSESYV